MATSSISKNINIKNPKLARALVNALENAQNKKCEKVILSQPCKTLRGEEIKDYFSNLETK